MAVTRENTAQSDKALQKQLEAMRENAVAYRAGSGPDRYAVEQSAEESENYVLGWSDPAKLYKRLATGSEIVHAKDAAKYNVDKSEVKAERIERDGLVLIRTPRVVWQARRDLAAITAIDTTGDALRDVSDTAEADRAKEHGNRAKPKHSLPTTAPADTATATDAIVRSHEREASRAAEHHADNTPAPAPAAAASSAGDKPQKK